MVMKLPKKISPNPLLISTVELRFKSSLDSVELFPLVYQSVMQDLPKLNNDNIIPKELKADPRLAYSPDYTLRNDDYLLSFSNKSLSFENVGAYKLWENYSSFIKKQLSALFELNFIQNIERIGLRYGSMFDGEYDLNNILINVPSCAIEGITEKVETYRSVFTVDSETAMILQVASSALANKNGNSLSGVYLDIDVSYNSDVSPNQEIFSIIDRLHSLEKDLFFKLLKPSFIQTLNPEY